MRLSSNNIEDGIVSNNIISSAYNMHTWEIFYALGLSDICMMYYAWKSESVRRTHNKILYVIGLGDDIKVIWHAQYFHCEFSDALRSKILQYIFKLFCFYFISYLMWHRKNKIYSQLCMLYFYSFIILYVSPKAYIHICS